MSSAPPAASLGRCNSVVLSENYIVGCINNFSEWNYKLVGMNIV
jgi:hypothetical protein